MADSSLGILAPVPSSHRRDRPFVCVQTLFTDLVVKRAPSFSIQHPGLQNILLHQTCSDSHNSSVPTSKHTHLRRHQLVSFTRPSCSRHDPTHFLPRVTVSFADEEHRDAALDPCSDPSQRIVLSNPLTNSCFAGVVSRSVFRNAP